MVQYKVIRVLTKLCKFVMRPPNQLSAITNESRPFQPQWIVHECAIRPDLLIIILKLRSKLHTSQHNDFTINFSLLLNFKESFLNYLNLGEKVADFSERSSRRFSSAVGAYWKHCIRYCINSKRHSYCCPMGSYFYSLSFVRSLSELVHFSQSWPTWTITMGPSIWWSAFHTLQYCILEG